MAAFSVVVVTWESAGDLLRLVESMNRHLDGTQELVVVDNASSDDPAGSARAWKGEGRFIGLDHNAGFGTAANAGTEASRHAAVVLLNPDSELVDSSLGRLVGVALSKQALAGPRLLNDDGSPQPSASGPPVGVWPWVGALIPGTIQPRAVRARTEPWRLETTTRVAWLTGACVAAPREVLLQLGPFDPAIHLYGEDIDLGIRAARAGIESWFCPDVCRIAHRGGASAAALVAEDREYQVVANRRGVLARAFGTRRETAAWLAHRANLTLRLLAKRAMGRDAEREAATLRAARRARTARALDPP
ncbi:MAG TPA: glycosyltransferase family 2 protein [Solirubrobacterales bacterium]|nr:glycosyltransferase family 2 protein [Solirubrobacterales bacterium]